MDKEGMLRLEPPDENAGLKPIYIRYDEDRFGVGFEPITLEDARLRSSWGEKIYRIVLTAKQTLLKDRLSITIEQ